MLLSKFKLATVT